VDIKEALYTILKVFEKYVLVSVGINGFEFYVEGSYLNGNKLELTAVPAYKCFKETEFKDYIIDLEQLSNDIWTLKLEYDDEKYNPFGFVFDLTLKTLTVFKAEEDKPYIHLDFDGTEWKVEDVKEIIKRLIEVE